MVPSKRVVVIGAGIVGLCVADSLLDKGFEVTVLDKDPAPGSGCSYGNTGLIVPSHFVPLASPGSLRAGMRMLFDRAGPFGIRGLTHLETLGFLAKFVRASNRKQVARAMPILKSLNLASRDLYEELEGKVANSIEYSRNGLLMLCRTQAAFDGEAHLARDAERFGLKVDLLDKGGLKGLEPDFEMDALGGVFFYDNAKFNPSNLMNELKRRVETRGGAVRTGAEVTGFRLKDNRIESIQIGPEAMPADEFVLAAGAWSSELAAELNLRIPMRAGKGYGFTVTDLATQPRHSAIFVEARIAVAPFSQGLRFVGTMELGPNDLSISPKRLEGMRRNVPTYYPSIKPASLNGPVWSGLRPCSPDGLPYIGRTQSASNLMIATGHAMMGMSLGPITGKLVSEVLTGQTPSIDLTLLSPDRYA